MKEAALNNKSFTVLVFCFSLTAVAAQMQPDVTAFTQISPDERLGFIGEINMDAMDTTTINRWYYPLLMAAEKEDDQRSAWALTLKYLQQRNHLRISKEQFLSGLEASYLKAQKAGWETEEVVAGHYLQFEKYSQKLISPEQMYAHILSEFEQMQTFGLEHFKRFDLIRLCYHSAKFMFDLEDFDNALHILHASEPYFETTGRGLQTHVFNLNLIESIYQQQKNYDQGIVYAQKLLNLVTHCPVNSDQDNFCKLWQGITYIDIADMMVKQGKYTEGELYADQGYAMVRESQQQQAEFDAMLILAPTKMALGKMAETLHLLRRMEDICQNAPNKDYYYFKKIRLYETFTRYYEKQGDLATAWRYSNLAQPLQDSLDRRNDARKLEKLKQRFEAQKYIEKIRMVENERQLQQMLRNALIVILALVLILAYGNFHRMRHLRRQSLKDLEAAQNALQNFTHRLREKSDMVENMRTEIDRLSRAGEQSEYLEKLTRSTILTDDDWSRFRSIFEKVHPDFITRQKQLYPGLTQAELRYLVLEKLQLSSREMANMLGVSDGTIRQTRLRLKRKIGES